MATTRRAKILFSIKRLTNFLKILRHNRRGMLGIVILVSYIAVAVAAPLITPYDPVFGFYLAGDYARPIWFKYVPGTGNLTENLDLVAQPGFPNSDSLQEWNFTETTSSAVVQLRYDPVGPLGEGGSAAIDFSRAAGRGYAGEVRAYLKKQFFYPFNSPPRLFECSVAVFTEGTANLQQVVIKVFLNRIGENTTWYPLWVKTITSGSEYWMTPQPPISSYASKSWVTEYFGPYAMDPASIIFTTATNYEYTVEIDFVDSKQGTLAQTVEATVYLDNLNVKIYGDSFGLLGTDHLGRDIFTQLIYGARLSLLVGLLSAVLSVVLGLGFGLVSGYLGKLADEVIMRFTDMLLVLPGLPLLLALIAVLGPGLMNLVILIGLLGWMGFARVVRAQVLSLRERPFIEAAKAVGAGKMHIITRHIIPNVMSLVYVSLALSVPSAILTEAALSWLGLYDPNVMSWGRMLFDVQTNHGVERWWWVIPPGLSIAAVSLSFILIGYALDEILNPKLRVRR